MGNVSAGKKSLIAAAPHVGLVVPHDTVCLEKIKAYLAHIQIEHRRTECKLIDKIINNILNNPYDTQYKRIHITKLSEKVSNNAIFFKILFYIGFKISEDNKQLIMNHSNLENLKHWQHAFCEVFINLYDLEQKIKQKETIQQQTNTFRRIDKLIGIYYKQMGIDNYFDSLNNKTGKFWKFIIDKELIDIDIPIHIQLERYHALYTEFDVDDFPVSDQVFALYDIDDGRTFINKRQAIFFVIQHCYKYDVIPKDQLIVDHMSNYMLKKKQNRNERKKKVSMSYDEAIPQHERLTTAKCICGEYLIKVNDGRNLYEESRKKVIRCSECSKTIKRDKIFYHCQKKYIDVHLKGFDVCDQCCITFQCSESNCVHINRFLSKMNKYRIQNDKQVDEAMMNLDFSTVVNELMSDYLHLLERHNNEYFEDVANENVISTQQCNINECMIFRRNYRDRSKASIIDDEKKQSYLDQEDMAYFEILDKMHCYFYHCYDIGNRLTMNENKLINECDLKSNEMSQELLINEKIIKTHKILTTKRAKCKSIYAQFTSRLNTKYNQIFAMDENDQKTMVQHNIDNHPKMYQFGYAFFYADADGDFNEKIKRIGPKYAHLKEEIVSNKIAVLFVKQFNSEYKKCKIHFASPFCKSKYKPFIAIFKTGTSSSQFSQRYINIEYLLSLMIYCNYTDLQYEFSKTYRENSGKNHSSFYHLGKFIYTVIRKFGHLNNKTLYHGVSQNLLFPIYVNTSPSYSRMYGETNDFSESGLLIQCPLSTTSEFEVATNFAGPEGLIIEFQGNVQCFSVDWLSDFPNEKEYVFIQMHKGLNMKNIIEPRSGMEYTLILSAFEHIKYLLQVTFFNSDPNASYDTNTYSRSYKPYPVTLASLIKVLFSHQLSRTLPQFDSSLSKLSKHAQHMCDLYFASYTVVDLRFLAWKHKSLSVFKLLCNCSNQFMDLKVLNVLLPNIENIKMREIDLKLVLLDHILSYFQDQHASSRCTELIITIEPETNPVESSTDSNQAILSPKAAVNRYSELFENINDVFIFINNNKNNENELHVKKWTRIEFICHIIDNVSHNTNIYIHSKSKILVYLNELIKTKLLQLKVNHKNTRIFYEHCNRKTTITIEWDNVYIFHVLNDSDLNSKWTKTQMLSSLFPNLESLEILDINLNTTIFEQILRYLKSTGIQSILITSPQITELSVLSHKQAVNQHSQQFVDHECFIFEDLRDGKLYIKKDRKVNFVTYALDKLGWIYFGGNASNTKMVMYMDRLIKNELTNNVNNDDIDQITFHQFCISKLEIFIHWKKVNSNLLKLTDSYVYNLLYHSQQEWIKLGLLNQLFPNIETLRFELIHLCTFVLDDILNHLNKQKTKIFKISMIMPRKNSELTKSEAVAKYKTLFKDINFTIKRSGQFDLQILKCI
eukprot:360614_1